MNFIPREQLIAELQQSFQSYINQYGIDDIGIFEEEGQDDQYHLGYTIKKEGKTYFIHSSYRKNNSGALAPINNEWTIETDEPQTKDLSGFDTMETALNQILEI